MSPVERDHKCQNDCGRLAEVVIVRLSESETDILCDTCHLMMMMAVAQGIAEQQATLDQATAGLGVDDAAEVPAG
jgi:hypothetical protein